MFPRDIVCLRNMSINNLHKGDDDDDDDDDDNNNNNSFVVPPVSVPFVNFKYLSIWWV